MLTNKEWDKIFQLIDQKFDKLEAKINQLESLYNKPSKVVKAPPVKKVAQEA
jgi:hypothetical protein